MEIANADKISSFVAKNQEVIDAHYEKDFPSLEAPVLTIKMGKKYAKVISNGATQRFVYAFIDVKTGNIYKPACWASPAKHSRGNVNSDQNGMEAVVSTQGGIKYMS